MNLAPVSALFLRRRSVWEAADSGILLWRKNLWYLIPFFVVPFALIALAVRLFLPSLPYTPYAFYLILWWLKPFFDRLILHIVSTRFFGSAPPSRMRELCRGLQAMRKGLIGDLLWRRFSPARAARMPIRVLERRGGKQYRERKEALGSGGLNFSLLVSFLCLALEALFLLSGILFVRIAFATFFPDALLYLRTVLPDIELLVYAAFCINYVIVESLYVCMCFGLYINSRVEVEGWDLQLLFKKFADTPTAVPRSSPVSKTGIALILCIMLTMLQLVHAEPSYFPNDFPTADVRQLETLNTILDSPDFGTVKDGWGIRRKNTGEPRPSPSINENAADAIRAMLNQIRDIAGNILRGLIVIALILATVILGGWAWKTHRGRFGVRNGGANYCKPLFSPESPETLFAAAEAAFKEGKLRKAWAACLSGCIGVFTLYRFLNFPADATEYACLEHLRASKTNCEGFAELVDHWVCFAYGGKIPTEDAFKRSLAYGRSLLPEARHEG